VDPGSVDPAARASLEPLFRAEARHGVSSKWYGEVLLIRPVSTTFFALLGLAIVAGVALFASLGTYTRRVSVMGQLVPDLGLVTIQAPQAATVKSRFISEDAQVTAGQTLFVLTAERHTSRMRNTHAYVSEQLEGKERSLAEEQEMIRTQESRERVDLRNQVASLKSDIGELQVLIERQEGRASASEAEAARYEGLLTQGYVIKEQVVRARGDREDQIAKLGGLRRELLNTERQLRETQSNLDTLAARYGGRLAEISRLAAENRQELVENEAQRDIQVVAPAGGRVAAVLAEVGQTVDASRALGSIIPQQARLVAQLYAPSSAVADIEVGARVWLRYRAYPYQRYGHFGGTILSVSAVAIPASEMLGTLTLRGLDLGEPVYRVTVGLDSQSIAVGTSARPLAAGMLLEGDLLQERRKVYEWIFEPLSRLRQQG
jgi:membrane fusion protein